jgi:hypothetical protein
MNRIGKTLCLVASVALWQGCSSSSSDNDGSADAEILTDAPAGDASTVFLSRGMNYYKITAGVALNDGCGVLPAAFVNDVIPANFVEATLILSVGTPQGVPLLPSLGSGTVSGVTGTLTRENDTADDGGCSWHQKDVSTFTLIGGDIFTLDVTESDSAYTAGCGTDVPAGGSCVSTYKLTLEKTTAPVDGGTN